MNRNLSCIRQVNVIILALLTYALRLLGISFVQNAEESLILEVSQTNVSTIEFLRNFF
jgi:hypothetical protein